MLRRVRALAAVSIGLTHKKEEEDEEKEEEKPLDFMGPLLRFQQLMKLANEKGKEDRFYNEINRLRYSLRKLHQEAERIFSEGLQ